MKGTVSSRIFYAVLILLMSMACSNDGSSGSNLVPKIILTQSTHNFSGVVLNNSTDHIFQIGNNGNANLNIGRITTLAAPY
ncbi:MAG: hypothetical protein P8Z37_07315 [Acidobacteriota bacterium]